MTTIAAFDFDGTLTARDSVVPFLERLAGGRARLIGGLLRHPARLAGGLARRDRDRLKALAVDVVFGGQEATEVEEIGRSFGELIRAEWLRPDTSKRLAWHREQGHQVVIVSASLGPYLRPLSEALGVDAVLCTEAAVGDDGRYTGALVGANCRGPEKLSRLEAWLSPTSIDDVELWVYGDSRGDRELLAAADHQLYVKDVEVSADPAFQA